MSKEKLKIIVEKKSTKSLKKAANQKENHQKCSKKNKKNVGEQATSYERDKKL